mmetsp:Transcript_4250/g.10288  ORF Transcript_4250/g.10288 Transcript_4250/m.10288 type:complete len:226 (-) Transcript_4250:38-715(-)
MGSRLSERIPYEPPEVPQLAVPPNKRSCRLLLERAPRTHAPPQLKHRGRARLALEGDLASRHDLEPRHAVVALELRLEAPRAQQRGARGRGLPGDPRGSVDRVSKDGVLASELRVAHEPAEAASRVQPGVELQPLLLGVADDLERKADARELPAVLGEPGEAKGEDGREALLVDGDLPGLAAKLDLGEVDHLAHHSLQQPGELYVHLLALKARHDEQDADGPVLR